MTSQEQIDLLKLGVEAWNKWREQHPGVQPQLSGARLTELAGADLSSADLTNSELKRANLTGANLARARLNGANLNYANLSRANLQRATLGGTHLYSADLTEADLTGAELVGANFSRTNFTRTRFTGAVAGLNVFADVDLSNVQDIESMRHLGPSAVDIQTLYRSKGKIPDAFMKGIGAPDNFIEYVKSLVNDPIIYYSCFISYSSKDWEFSNRLYIDLQSEGVRCWFAPEDLKIGDRFRERIDESIRVYDKLLLVLSENSINSPWVESEVEAAFEKEHRQSRTVLFPIRLDATVMETNKAWAADIRRSRHIGEFQNWRHHDSYQLALKRLLKGLKSVSALALP